MADKRSRRIWERRTPHCPACGKGFAARDQRVRIGGVLFHRSCAVVESRLGGSSARMP